jgi:hypothetical protein
MSDKASEDVDPEVLREDLDRIKDAMGIAERYESAAEQWLVFGLVVALGCAASQFVLLEALPAYWYAVVWFGLFGATFAVLGSRYGYSWGPGVGNPNIGFQILVVYLGAFVIQLAAEPFLTDLGRLAENAFVLSIIVAMLGLGYLVAGETLKAYNIRARDRYAFHAGGLLLVALGVAIPNVELLHTWGYTAFGASYLAYAAASYLVLTQT